MHKNAEANFLPESKILWSFKHFTGMEQVYDGLVTKNEKNFS